MSWFWSFFSLIILFGLLNRWRHWGLEKSWYLALFLFIAGSASLYSVIYWGQNFNLPWLFFFLTLIWLGLFFFCYTLRQWYGLEPHQNPLIFLDARLAVRPSVLGHTLPEGYRLACLFFGTGLIDRTKTLDQGFDYEVLDPIPEPQSHTDDIAHLCDQRAQYLIEISRKENKPIRLLWSGGIDSTAACVALLRALKDEPKRLEIVYSPRSRGEYRFFFKNYVRKHPNKRKISRIFDALNTKALITSGEHGDQIFGSMKALGLPMTTLHEPWQKAFPELLIKQLASPGRVETVLKYLHPQFSKCPVPLVTLFDLLWWMNFSMKWQAVSLRIPVLISQNHFRKQHPLMHHFFRTRDFQLWAMANPDKRIKHDWQSYKWPLKEYIRAFTNDNTYYRTKEKQPSLRGISFQKKHGLRGLALAVDNQQTYFYQRFNDTLRYKASADVKAKANHSSSYDISYEGINFQVEYRVSTKREDPLWDDLSDGE